MGKLLIVTGIILIILGLIIHFGKGSIIGNLPGDIRIKKEKFSVYIPIVTSLVISIILTLVLYLINKFK